MSWQLLYAGRGVHPGASLAFGRGSVGYIMTRQPMPSTPDVRSERYSTPRADGVQMGRDYIDGTTIPIDLVVDGRSEAEGRALAEALRIAWRADAVRTTPMAVAELVAPSGLRAFGRPGRYTADPRFMHVGRYDVTADFATVDDLWYGDEQSAEVELQPAAGGGLVAPLVAPLTTTGPTNRRREFQVGGAMPTWAVVDIIGPIISPIFEIPGVLTFEFTGSLAAGEVATIDARTWSRSVKVNGANARGRLGRRSTPLTEALVPPGQHEIVLRGVSDTGTARARLRWADAHPIY